MDCFGTWCLIRNRAATAEVPLACEGCSANLGWGSYRPFGYQCRGWVAVATTLLELIQIGSLNLSLQVPRLPLGLRLCRARIVEFGTSIGGTMTAGPSMSVASFAVFGPFLCVSSEFWQLKIVSVDEFENKLTL